MSEVKLNDSVQIKSISVGLYIENGMTPPNIDIGAIGRVVPLYLDGLENSSKYRRVEFSQCEWTIHIDDLGAFPQEPPTEQKETLFCKCLNTHINCKCDDEPFTFTSPPEQVVEPISVKVCGQNKVTKLWLLRSPDKVVYSQQSIDTLLSRIKELEFSQYIMEWLNDKPSRFWREIQEIMINRGDIQLATEIETGFGYKEEKGGIGFCYFTPNTLMKLIREDLPSLQSQVDELKKKYNSLVDAGFVMTRMNLNTVKKNTTLTTENKELRKLMNNCKYTSVCPCCIANKKDLTRALHPNNESEENDGR